MTEVLELVSTDALLKLMPIQMSTHVRDGKPKTLEAAANLADDFVITRGWTYNVVTKSDRSAKQGRQHKKDERPHDLGEQHSSEVKQSHQTHRSRPGRSQIGMVEDYQNLTSKTDPDVFSATNMDISLRNAMGRDEMAPNRNWRLSTLPNP